MVSTIGSSLLLFAVGTLFVPAQCCEDPFIDVAGKCLYFVNEMNMTHFQSFELCEILHSQLAVITTPTQLYDVVQYIQLNNYSAQSYWLGGNDAFSEDNWRYALDLPVPRGTPFWATHETSASTWIQLPTHNTTRNCLSLTEVQHYYFTDDDCNELYSPICEVGLVSTARKGSDESLDDYPEYSEIESRAARKGSDERLDEYPEYSEIEPRAARKESDERLDDYPEYSEIELHAAEEKGSDESLGDYPENFKIEPRAAGKGSDESLEEICTSGQFYCGTTGTKTCIPASDICNGANNCGNNYDEHYCTDDPTIKDSVGTNGRVHSPGNEFETSLPDLDLTWTVSIDPRVATNESYLTVYIDECDFYTGAYLSIRDGPDENSVEIARYAKTEGKGKDVTSSGSQLYFNLYTEAGAIYSEGFLFRWEAVNIQCGENYVGENGMISSVNYGGNYLGNVDCEWTIQSPLELTMPNTIVQLTILQFDTQLGNDYLEIRDGNSTSSIITTLSGHTWPQDPISSTGSKIHLHFHADDDLITYTGFQIQWHAVVCPEPYMVVGDLCIYFVWFDFKWGEASIACKQIGGHLARINDPEQLRTIHTYLHENNIDQDSYWIDGKGNMESGSWLWQDNTLVPTGTPFWGLNGDGRIQEPDNQGDESCLVMLGEGFHYFRDADCNQKYKSICMTDVVKQ